ncbi:hypothetical protein GUJ93_ZPchr0004g39418 [Zizania palustris]|uniref:Uncharacterized protein n=1 Tax=Zizania palustris TaxID=103762 RepID=A0A8J5SHY6_ZIZPA|nr:hypothetical protein GUJ93_ZPchr0004g39418 [Zizania palustris]
MLLLAWAGAGEESGKAKTDGETFHRRRNSRNPRVGTGRFGRVLVLRRRETYPPSTVLADGDLGLQTYPVGYHPKHPLRRGIEIWRYLLRLAWKSGIVGGGDVLL